MSNTRTVKTDMTSGSVWKVILMFALPIMLGNMLQQLYNTVDGIIVGREVNSNALAAIGTCSTLARFFLCFSMGFSNGCGVMISQYFGAKREEDIKKSFTTGAIIAIAIGVVITIIGVTLRHWILATLMAITDLEVLDYATQYFTIYCLGLVFTYAYNYIAYTLRAFGDSRSTLYFLALTSVLNLILDLLMVPWMGIAGAAVATVISQIVCAAVSYIYMRRRYQSLNIRLREYRFDREKSKMCITLGIPAILQMCSVSMGNLFMQRLVNSFGNVTMAAYTVGGKIEGYIHTPVSGIQQSMSVYTGQNIGAGKTDRVKKGLYSAVAINVICCGLVALLGLFGSSALAEAFGLEGESLSQAVEMISFYTYTSFTMLFFGLYFACSGIIHGAGDVGYATFVSLTALASRVVISYACVYGFQVDHRILWQSTLVSNGVSMILVWIRYFSGRWKLKSERIIGRRT